MYDIFKLKIINIEFSYVNKFLISEAYTLNVSNWKSLEIMRRHVTAAKAYIYTEKVKQVNFHTTCYTIN